MTSMIMDISEILALAACGFLVKKYVFLEPDLESKKQWIFLGAAFLIIAGVFFAFGKDGASVAVIAAIALNICISRKKRKLMGLLLMIPFMGIINGLVVPVMMVPPYLLSFSESGKMLYQFFVYGTLAVLLAVFLIKGRKWRVWFAENMKNRSLRISERGLLWLVGIVMMVFVNVGVMKIAANGGESYPTEVMAFIGVGSLVAFIMTITIIVLIIQGNKRSFYHERLWGMQSGMITFMAEVVENRDDNTGGHIRRTAKYVEVIARELKRKGVYSDILTDGYINDMVVAAPLHDIGKIHIPDAVLNKPGKLTDEEFEIMKTHTTAGEKLLNLAKEELGESEYLKIAVKMAAYHHEKWNGGGYPYGIHGYEIPLCARIMAVADVFDALTSKRVYKSAMPLEKAYSIIKEGSGTHFDPEIVEAFFAVTDDIEKMIETE